MTADLTLCIALLGLFLAAPLLAAARRRPANAWLAAFVLAISSLAAADYAFATQLYARHPGLLGVFDWPAAGLGGLYYLYVLGMSGGVRRRHLWHLLPLLLWAAWLIHLRLTVPVDVLLSRSAHAPHTSFQPILLTCQLAVAAYLLATLGQLRRYRVALREHYSNTARLDLAWLRWLTIAMSMQFCLWLPATLAGPAWESALDICRLATLYLLGWFGMRQSAVFLPAKIEDPPAPSAPHPGPVTVQTLPSTKYARSGMTEAARALIGQRLAQRMASEKIYQDANLTLASLADKIGTSPQLLSQYLNEALGMSFFEYINQARVEAVQRAMLDAATPHPTLLDLAFAAGFSSKSAFNASFKRVTGMTPSQWKKQAQAAGAPVLQGDAAPIEAATS